MFKKYLVYLQNNPKNYWFKRKIYGWGWVPVKWQGWLVTVVGVAIILGGVFIGETDDAPGAVFISALLALIFMLIFCYWKGEKPRWEWGLDKKITSRK